MQAIAAVDKNWAIGNRGKLLVSIPEDMKLFRKETRGNVVVMGRKTLESFPGKRPLPDRTNIVLTASPDYECEGAVVVSSLDELFFALKEYESGRVYVIGGETIYRQLLPYCETAIITKIDMDYEADAYFPDLDREDGWSLTRESEEQTYLDICYAFTQYRNERPRTWTSQEEN